ncbi:hypothetical protein WN51_09381 [Melipona quadrifasciata]|uniref:Uncharacterized protein n=1 Tax=Melipona quadrifasciata TaxID=166423 RepID=A0A0M9A6Z1_9HYME|nr:hypothetical protein WN51_09381 [Melipona quadrifasciata]
MPDDSPPADGSTENPSIPFDPQIRIPVEKQRGFRKTEPDAKVSDLVLQSNLLFACDSRRTVCHPR